MKAGSALLAVVSFFLLSQSELAAQPTLAPGSIEAPGAPLDVVGPPSDPSLAVEYHQIDRLERSSTNRRKVGTGLVLGGAVALAGGAALLKRSEQAEGLDGLGDVVWGVMLLHAGIGLSVTGGFTLLSSHLRGREAEDRRAALSVSPTPGGGFSAGLSGSF